MRFLDGAPRLHLPPTKSGTYGKAWRIDLDVLRARYPTPDAAVCSWIVEAPWAHPVWHSYWLFAVHLREMGGLPAPKINLQGATHEVILFALDPVHTPALHDIPKYLTPMNFAGQWIAESDEAAAAKVESCVDEILSGALNPDTDARSQWIARFSASNMKIPAALADLTFIKKEGDSVTVIGTGKTAMDAITTIAAGPVPPKKEQH